MKILETNKRNENVKNQNIRNKIEQIVGNLPWCKKLCPLICNYLYKHMALLLVSICHLHLLSDLLSLIIVSWMYVVFIVVTLDDAILIN